MAQPGLTKQDIAILQIATEALMGYEKILTLQGRACLRHIVCDDGPEALAFRQNAHRDLETMQKLLKRIQGDK